MEHITPESLTSLTPRMTYTASFLGFTPEDGAAINASGPLIAPLLQAVLDLVYTKLLNYDITAQAFVPKHSVDHPDEKEPSTPQELNLEHSHIRRQMSFLKGYLLKIVGNKDWAPSSALRAYMDKIAVAHTGLPGFTHRAKRPNLRVEYMHMGLLLGYVADIVIGAVMGMEAIDLPTKGNVIKGWNKLLWLQNDLFARRYVVDRETGESPVGITDGVPSGDGQIS